MIKPPRTYSVEIPTKTYLRKYVYATYGYPLHLKYDSSLSTLILCLLEKDYFAIDMNQEKKDVRLGQMNDKIEVFSPLSKLSHRGFSLSNDKIIAINRYLEHEFQQEIYKYCRDNIEKRSWRPGRDKAIYSFAAQFGIDVDVDITFDALKKAEYRYRKKREENLTTFVPPQNRPSSTQIFGLRIA